SLHFFVGDNVHAIAVSAGVDDALVADIKCAAVLAVQFLVGILFPQFQQQRRQVARVTAGGVKSAGGIGGGGLVQALVPINLQWRHVAAGGNVPANAAANGVTLVAAAANVLGFHARGMINLERPIHAVQHVAAHVADGAVAEIIPAVPLMR